MESPGLPPAPPMPPKVCALCGEALTGEFCPKCGAESMNLRVRPAPPGLQFTPINHFWVILLITGFAFGILYNVVAKTGMVQTYAMFVGIPLVIGVLVAYLSRPQTGLGNTLKIVTLLLCVVCPLVGEFSVCVLMAAPLFYTFAVGGYFLFKWTTPKRRHGPMALLIVPFVLAMMTSDKNHIDNPATNIVTDEIFVAAPAERVMQTIEQSTQVPHDLSAFLKLGFPYPKRVERDPNGRTRIVFDPGAEAWNGTNTIVSQQTVDPIHHTITYTIFEDGTKLARWMTFRSIDFEIEPRPGGCLVRQRTVYDQRMQPGFYWNSVEDFAMGQMHGYVLRNIKRQTEAAKP